MTAADRDANEADVEEQEQALDEETPDEEAVADAAVPPRRDDVDEADYLEQSEPLPADDEDYAYDEGE